LDDFSRQIDIDTTTTAELTYRNRNRSPAAKDGSYHTKPAGMNPNHPMLACLSWGVWSGPGESMEDVGYIRTRPKRGARGSTGRDMRCESILGAGTLLAKLDESLETIGAVSG